MRTPGSWEIIPNYVSPDMGVTEGIQDAAEARVVAECFGDDEGPANAAFIVQACNAHDPLVKALQEIADADWSLSASRKIANDALAIAKGEHDGN